MTASLRYSGNFERRVLHTGEDSSDEQRPRI